MRVRIPSGSLLIIAKIQIRRRAQLYNNVIMEEKENIGYIYKITNKINGKVYIGQTRKSIKQRWNDHKAISNSPEKQGYDYPLYRAFRKYGIENFKIEEIEKCHFEKLNEREIYWIKYYNSIKENGYNQLLGGSGSRTLELNENEVIKKYKELHTLLAVATYYNCSPSSIHVILEKHNIEIVPAQEHAKQKSFTVYMLNDKHEIIKTFSSLREAGRWISEQGLTKSSPTLAYSLIVDALHTEQKRCGYYWYCTKYSEKEKNEYQQQKTKKRKSNSKKQKIKKIICPVCGNLMNKNSKKCLTCRTKELKEKAIREKEEKGITREFLKSEIRTKPFIQIGKEQGVTDNSIRKWCKLFNLPYKSSVIKKYTDEEWKNV